MKNAVIALLLFLFSSSAMAQISHGGLPHFWDTAEKLAYETYEVDEVDLKNLREEDALNDKLTGVPYRFGKNIEVDLDIHNSGTWTELDNGDGIWRLAILSKGATSLNFVFDSYSLPLGAKVFVYTEDHSQLLGSFTRENASKSNTLGIGLLFSEKVIIEYHEPANVRGEGYLHIGNVTHGYRDVLVDVEMEEKGIFGNSGNCNINVNCPEGLPFDFQKRSVALIVVNNNALCSGAMVNNTQQDGTPFFLTANHCLPGNPNSTQNWVFYFNHETPGCSGNNGPTNQSISGGTVLSSNAESDFALLELNSSPPASYNVCFSGWDATDSEATVSSTYGIHHPSGDVKKICFDQDAPYHDVLSSFVDQVWFIDQWESGVTEGGSSGSPLFNQNGLLIGQLAGGQAACNGDVNNGSFDYYGRMGVSWDYGTTASTSLRFALDPANTGILIVPNSCNANLPDLNASLGLINGISDAYCNLFSSSLNINVVNLGTQAIQEIVLEVNLNGNIELVNWSGNLLPQQNTTVELGEITPDVGVNNLSVQIVSLNGEEDTDPLGNNAEKSFEAFDQALSVEVFIDLDNYPGETTWIITSELNEVIASGGPYNSGNDPVSETVCLPSGGCYEFTIFDDANDGLCCGFGLGSYSVTDQFGTVYVEGGEFGSSETTEICAALDTQNAKKGQVSLFPNPATNILKISTVNDVIDRVSIFDISGKLISQKTGINSFRTVFNTNALPSGLYIVEIVGVDGRFTREKVMVAKDE